MLRDDLASPLEPEVAGPLSPEPAAPEAPPRWRWWKRGIYAAFGLTVLLFLWLIVTAPLSKSLQPIEPPAITLLSEQGRPIARRGAVVEQPVDAAALPRHVIEPFLAIEDRRFYDHWGIDPRGIARAAWANMQAGGVREGGSTISQQLAKLVFLSADRTAGRKVQEMILALWLEAWLTKDEILSRYLSTVYFGDNVYGLRAAAHHYFSRAPEKLTVEQAAMLAGLVKAPSRLAPTDNFKGALQRETVVIGAMVDAGFLTPAEAARLPAPRLKVAPIRDVPTGTYFADWVFPQARAMAEAGYGEQTVETTLDDKLQRLAVDAVRRASLGGAQVALVAMKPDGTVVAMVGGKSYRDSPFNRATQAKRQPGSTFKLFVYLAALREGMDPESKILDAPLTIGDWSPKNAGGRYRGLITLREAFAASSNVAAVRLQEQVGRDKVIQAARDLGIRAPLTSDPTLALGTSEVNLIDMTAAYAGVAGGRFPVTPHGLADAGNEGWFQRVRTAIRSFRERGIRPMLLDLLFASANEGTGRAAALDVETYGKTGTSQDNRDALFIGFADGLVTGVWVGNDDNKPLRGVSGGTVPARIWRDFMSRAVGARAAGSVAPRQAEEETDEPQLDIDNEAAEINVPIDELGVDIGAHITRDGVVVSAQPREPIDPAETEIGPPPPDEGEEGPIERDQN